MSNRHALPIFSTSAVDSVSSPRRNGVTTPRKHNTSANTTPVSSRLNSSREAFKTPRSQLISRQKWKSTNSIDSAQSKKVEKSVSSQGIHCCSPSLSPKSSRIARFCSDTSLNDSATDPLATPTSPKGENSHFVVGVRVRPFNAREEKDKAVRNVVTMKNNEVSLTCASGVHTFSYDHCFWSFDRTHDQYASQEAVFQTMVQPLLDQVMMGYNACLLAYGQTGSGKSYSMMGLESGGDKMSPDAGIIPRFCSALFEQVSSSAHEIRVEISYYEIYNEKIHDLLSSNKEGPRPALRVRENPSTGPYVVDLAVNGVTTFSDVKTWLTVGNNNRITAATMVNDKSSRSHSIFTVLVTQKKDGVTCFSQANLVDLAGSERVAQTASTDHQMKEGVSINKSLLSLGKVITSLSERGRRRGASNFLPYRESVLTWLLRESLGGNSKTTMLATISPANVHLDETLATLRYACQARSIVNRVHPNEDPNERIIRELRMELEKMSLLQAEVERLKQQSGAQDNSDKEAEINKLKLQLRDAQAKIGNDQRPWEEKVHESAVRKEEEIEYLRGCGVSVTSEESADTTNPCLVTLSPDPILSGIVLYMLPPGKKTVGRSSSADIVLQSHLVGQKHCELENQSGTVVLRPFQGFETFVNGIGVTHEVRLRHGDRLAVAGVHFFRVRCDAAAGTGGADFDQAQKELKREQEARLRSELKEEMNAAHLQNMQGVLAMLDEKTTLLNEERKEKIVDDEEPISIPSYHSTFLDDLHALLYRRRDKTDMSLLDMHLLVREGTSRSRELELELEFYQEHLVNDKGVTPAIRVINKGTKKFAIWRHADFFKFLDAAREAEHKDAVLLALESIETVWEYCTEEPKPTRRISVKRRSMPASPRTPVSPISDQTYDPNHYIQQTLKDLQKIESRLKSVSKKDDHFEKAMPHFRALMDSLSDSSIKTVRFEAPHITSAG